jgi:dynein heavy chain, axonemal
LHLIAYDRVPHQVHTVVFNPKCISMGELYGEFNELTQEWTDGLASFFIRQAVVDTSETAAHRWTVFDGPVDALWIENMNTVLDDNMTLCLANAERIKLNFQMRMLFEVQDLAAASPATVSRCGMVYVSDETLGWQPLIASWAAKTLPLFGWDAPATALLKGLFHKHVPAALSFVRLRCKEIVPTVDAALVMALSSLFASLIGYAGLVPERHAEQPLPSASAVRAAGGGADTKGAAGGVGAAADAEDSSERISSRGITSLFIFCLVWTLGGSIDEASRAAFDEFVRKHVDPEGSIVPTHGTLR